MPKLRRVPDWDRQLPRVWEKHSELPGAWGVSDCWIVTMDAVEAITGVRIYRDLRSYSTEAGGYKLFAKQGFKTVEQALAKKFSRLPTPMLAQRGDVGVVERDGVISAGYFDAEGFVTRSLDAVTRLPVTEVKAAFKVARA